MEEHESPFATRLGIFHDGVSVSFLLLSLLDCVRVQIWLDGKASDTLFRVAGWLLMKLSHWVVRGKM